MSQIGPGQVTERHCLDAVELVEEGVNSNQGRAAARLEKVVGIEVRPYQTRAALEPYSESQRGRQLPDRNAGHRDSQPVPAEGKPDGTDETAGVRAP